MQLVDSLAHALNVELDKRLVRRLLPFSSVFARGIKHSKVAMNVSEVIARKAERRVAIAGGLQ